jgi:hypothetical protein
MVHELRPKPFEFYRSGEATRYCFNCISAVNRFCADRSMVAAAGLTSFALGATLAYAAGRVPAHVEVLETVGGALLIVGLVLLGWSLPVVS